MTHCSVCSSTGSEPFVTKAGWTYRTCMHCGHVSLLPRPGPADIDELYEASYFQRGDGGGYRDYAGAERWHRRNARARLGLLAIHGAVPPGLLLDVGCAYGYAMTEAAHAGWQCVGVEPSEHARKEARRRGHTVLTSLEDTVGDFDVALALQVVEHAIDPDALLSGVRSRMRQGGTLLIETWDRSSRLARIMGRNWQQITPPSVVHLFSRDGLARLAAAQGFEVLTVRSVSKWVSIGNVVGLAAYKTRGSGSGRRRRLSAVGLPYRLGDLVVFVARAV